MFKICNVEMYSKNIFYIIHNARYLYIIQSNTLFVYEIVYHKFLCRESDKVNEAE